MTPCIYSASIVKHITTITTMKLYQSSMDREDNGRFARKYAEAKKLRTMQLTGTAWRNLEKIAEANGCTRTDLIEAWARTTVSEQAILLRAIEKFIELERLEFGENSMQKGRRFSMDSRKWDAFRKFTAIASSSPSQLLNQEQ